MKYKALMLDVDGVLISEYGSLPSAKVTTALNNVRNKIHIGLVTSRPYILIKQIINHLQLNDPSITQGGSRIIDSSTGKVLWEQCIKVDDLHKICEMLLKHKVEFVLNDDGAYHNYNADYIPYKPLHIWVKQILDPRVGSKIVKSLSQVSSIAATTTPASTDREKVQIIITHASATKQHGIFEISKILGIKTNEIIGVGDGYNDFPLLMACGLKVAMENANDDLKAIADFIAPSVDQDGLVAVITKYI